MNSSNSSISESYKERKIVRFNENLHAVGLTSNKQQQQNENDQQQQKSGFNLFSFHPAAANNNNSPSSDFKTAASIIDQQQELEQTASVDRITGRKLLPQQTEQKKRELLAKQLGRSPQSISGPELDAFQFISWKDLPPCPIHGMKLAEKGLYDSDVGRFLDVDEIRDLINKAGKLEAVANQTSENRLLGTTMQRIFEIAFEFSRVCIVGMLGFFWGYKTPQAYLQAYPRKSIFVTRYYSKFKTNEEIEVLCQRNKALFNATNPRVMFLWVCGFAGFMFGAIGEYYHRVPDEYRDVTKEAIRHNHHFEGTMKWLFSVYYHHPAYAEAANSKRSRNILTSTPMNPPRRGPTPNLDSRRAPWEEQIPNR
jgi:hypothetical protein